LVDLYNYFDNFHILGTLPVYGYTEGKVNESMNEATQGKCIVAFPCQQWLRERATELRYSTLLILFDLEALSLI